MVNYSNILNEQNSLFFNNYNNNQKEIDINKL